MACDLSRWDHERLRVAAQRCSPRIWRRVRDGSFTVRSIKNQYKRWRKRHTKEATMAVQVDEADVSRDELVEYLTNICAFAKRQQHITAKLSTDAPTAWDKAHRLMDGPLDDLLRR